MCTCPLINNEKGLRLLYLLVRFNKVRFFFFFSVNVRVVSGCLKSSTLVELHFYCERSTPITNHTLL